MKDRPRQLCLNCHKTADLTQAAGHRGFQVGKSACERCHTSHSSNNAGLLRDNLHEPFKEKKCDECHVGGVASGRLRKPDQRLCLRCHEGVQEQFRTIFRHVQGPEENFCLHCHDPHGSDTTALRRDSERQMCFQCHPDTRRRMQQADLSHRHPVTEEVQCTACHRPHGSDQRLFMETDEDTACAGCHTHQSEFRHPTGPDAPDPRSKRAMNCMSCHNPMGSAYEFNLLFERNRELCIQCHKR